MVHEDEYLFLDLHQCFLFNHERTEELMDGGYIADGHGLTAKAQDFISQFYENHKGSVLEQYQVVQNTPFTEEEFLQDVQLTHFQTVRLILKQLEEEGRVEIKDQRFIH